MRVKWLAVWVVGIVLGSVPSVVEAATWFALGPYGGDARSISADPRDSKHLYLGTITGWVFESRDGGASWRRLARVGKRSDLVIDHIIVSPVDSRHLVAGCVYL